MRASSGTAASCLLDTQLGFKLTSVGLEGVVDRPVVVMIDVSWSRSLLLDPSC